MLGDAKSQTLDEIKAAFTPEKMAEYAAQQKGVKPQKTREGWRIGHRGAGAGLVIYADGHFHDFSEDASGDCLDLVKHLDGISDFNQVLERAGDVVGIDGNAPKTAHKPRNDARRDDKATKAQDCDKTSNRRAYDAVSSIWDELRAGTTSDACKRWMTQRGFDLDLGRLLDVGFSVEAHKVWVEGKQYFNIPDNALVVRDPERRLVKTIGFDRATGKRTSKVWQSVGGNTYWIPAPVQDGAPVFLTEGETSAIALICAGYCARPVKPDGDGCEIIKTLSGTHRLVLAYDNDKQGCGYTEKALKIAPEALDIAPLFGTDCDPNDFLIEMGAGRARRLIDLELTRPAVKAAESAQEAPKKGKKVEARKLAEAFYDGWRFDEFSGELSDRDGCMKNLDEAIAECVRSNECIKEYNAREVATNFIIHNPARRFNSLTQRVYDLAAKYTQSGAIDRFCRDACLDRYETRRLRLWLYEMCARALYPGEKCDCALILASEEQGLSKTKFLEQMSRVLTGKTCYLLPAFPDGKDVALAMSQNAIFNIDEFDRFVKRLDVATIKGMMSQTGSFVRAPYDKAPKFRKNTAVFAGTTNELNPIPVGEADARRYWVIRLHKPLVYDTKTLEAVLIEAAYDVVMSTHGVELDPCTTDNKIWVETDQERLETIERNQHAKASDNASIAISVGATLLKKYCIDENKCYPAGVWATVFSTGALDAVGGSQLVVSLPKCEAAKVRRLITARVKRAKDSTGANGYRLKDLAEVFSEDDHADQDLGRDQEQLKTASQTGESSNGSKPDQNRTDQTSAQFVECGADDNPFVAEVDVPIFRYNG